MNAWIRRNFRGAGVVQARWGGPLRLYANLNPRLALDVDREGIFKLRESFGNFRLQRGSSHIQMLPHGRYIFVSRTQGDILMHPRYRHPVLAEGRPVLYAGEAFFQSGQLDWWSNASGNYRPDIRHAEQAGLPMELFQPFGSFAQSRKVGKESGTGINSGSAARPLYCTRLKA